MLGKEFFKPGINTNFEVGLNQKESLDAIKKAGIEHIMISELEGDLEEIIKYSLEIGLKNPYVHLAYGRKDALWTPGEENERYLKQIIKSIKVCGKYNIPIAVMHIVWHNSPVPNQFGIESMKKILAVAKKVNVRVAIENLAVQGDEQLCYLLDNIQSKWLGFCYDVGHHYRHVHDTEIAKRYGDRMIAIHVHDNYFREAADLHLLPFDGRMDFDEVARDIAHSSYTGVLMIEFHKNWEKESRKLYDKLTSVQAIKVAKRRAKKLARMIKRYRRKV